MSTARTAGNRSVEASGSGELGPALRVTRIVLITLGLAGLAWGAYVLFDSVKPARIPGIAIWMGAAIVLHDGVISPLVFFCGILLRRAGHRISGTVILVVQGAIVVGSVMSLIVVPLLIAQSRGTGNPTVLPLDYGVNFAVFWAAVAVVTAAVSFGLYARGRRRLR
ncbi:MULTISPECIES: hypothetical protein [unclassified Cryobacterium]|uniref:hypothetical protein n=1 Tax=unclassified Cryobacterium TaxID=2649013 RepID=UPI002AB5572D|nr:MULTISPECIES: hypothetical protein [unclassified Cryobacterium]MDY7526704.1 hypothetical protein [Cryobacterium sp. 10C2]MDY7557490.1 hypothetical protein [Cryobacterium sp. 10C3]MEB0291493.1 hypothetical protein [Cryobacterium sp. 10C2]